jgi:hypothetical protein
MKSAWEAAFKIKRKNIKNFILFGLAFLYFILDLKTIYSVFQKMEEQ